MWFDDLDVPDPARVVSVAHFEAGNDVRVLAEQGKGDDEKGAAVGEEEVTHKVAFRTNSDEKKGK